MNNPWCYYGGRGREKIEVGYVATPFPGYHAAPWRPGAQGMWRDYDGQRTWYEKDRIKFSPEAAAAMRAELEKQRKAKRNKFLVIGGAAALAIWKLFA